MASSCKRLAGKVAIITGSSSGMGAGIATAFAKEGALVTINGRNEEALKKVAEECEKASENKSKPLLVIGDITDENVRKNLVEKTLSNFGKIDILVNNAGVYKKHLFLETEGLELLDFHLNVHLRAPYHLTQLAVKHIIKTKGVIINMSSVAAMRTSGGGTIDYSIAKAAMSHFTSFLAMELGPKGVRVNSICPGYISTNFLRRVGVTEEQEKEIQGVLGKFHALGRGGTVDEVSRAAVFLASDEASFVTGVNMPVDGGSLVVASFDF